MDTMILAGRNVKGFTLLEALISLTLVTMGTAALVASLRHGDFMALQTRIDARASQELAKQASWVLALPTSQFAASLGTSSEYKERSDEEDPRLLIRQASGFMLPNTSAFGYHTEITVTRDPSFPGAYGVVLATTWESPSPARGHQVREKTMTISDISKWP